MNLVDSSAWLEYFADGPNGGYFAAPIEDTKNLIVPTLCLYEVFKRVLQQRGEDGALQAVVIMQQGKVIPLDATLSINAAKLSVQFRLPMADSIILAAAQSFHATLWTQDADFQGMAGVKYVNKKGG